MFAFVDSCGILLQWLRVRVLHSRVHDLAFATGATERQRPLSGKIQGKQERWITSWNHVQAGRLYTWMETRPVTMAGQDVCIRHRLRPLPVGNPFTSVSSVWTRNTVHSAPRNAEAGNKRHWSRDNMSCLSHAKNTHDACAAVLYVVLRCLTGRRKELGGAASTHTGELHDKTDRTRCWASIEYVHRVLSWRCGLASSCDPPPKRVPTPWVLPRKRSSGLY